MKLKIQSANAFILKKYLALILFVIFFLTLIQNTSSGAEAYNLYTRTLHLEYDIFVGGFKAGHIGLFASLKLDRYELNANIKSVGLLDYVTGFRSKAQSLGSIFEMTVAPELHQAKNLWMKASRQVRIEYFINAGNTKGPKITSVHPKATDDSRDPVPIKQRRNTIDPLSAILQAAYSSPELNHVNSLSQIFAIFDGRRRYNVKLNDLGEDYIQGPFFQGTARKSRLEIERIGGFSRKSFSYGDSNYKKVKSGEIWFAKVLPDWPPLPIRFKADVGLGNALVHLMKYQHLNDNE